MKCLRSLVAITFLGTFLFTSCVPDENKIDEDKSFDQTLLYGKWQLVKGTVFIVYTADGKGYTWDTSEGVTEADAKKPGDEGQTFTWELTANNLIEMHFGARTQRSYVIKVLNKDFYERASGDKIEQYNKVTE